MDYECVVVGGGISGLSAAEALARQGARVLLVEAGTLIGGAMRSERTPDGFLLEHGPNTVTSNDPGLWQSFADLGIADERLVAASSGARRYVLFNGALLPIPLGPQGAISTPLISPTGKLRMLAELLMPRSAAPDESVAAFFSRRLGREPFERLIDPFISGVYAGDPEALSARAAFGRLWDAEQRAGSIVRGMIAGRSRPRGAPKPGRRELFSFREGLMRWPAAIGAYLGPDRLWTDTSLVGLQRSGDAWELSLRREGQSARLLAGQVVLATPAYVAADLIASLDGDAAAALRGIPYPPLAVVHLGYRREDVAHPIDGFGALYPDREERRLLGTLWPSALFPGRAPEGVVLTSSFIGGARHPELARLSDTVLIAIARAEQRELIGADGSPLLASVARWERAIPQYVAGHLDRIAAVERFEAGQPGLHLLGNYRGGVSVERCWQRGREVAAAVAEARCPQAASVGGADSTKGQKRLLRPDLIARRDQVADRDARSAAIREQVIALPAFQRARAIHCYLSIHSEVDTRLLIAAALDQGKAVAVPVIGADRRMSHSWIRDIDPADFTEGVLGTLTPRVIRPALPGDWDITIVPLLGFDREGYRIGYGKGYYDRMLAAAPAFAIGVAFAAQEVANLPHADHDMRLDAIVTEDEIIALRALPA